MISALKILAVAALCYLNLFLYSKMQTYSTKKFTKYQCNIVVVIMMSLHFINFWVKFLGESCLFPIKLSRIDPNFT